MLQKKIDEPGPDDDETALQNIKDQITNLKRVLEMNDDDIAASEKILISHKNYLQDEREKFQKFVNNIDQIIDDCDR